MLAAAAPYQLAPLPGRANSVGVARYTLGGGTGWLSRKHGFAADSVLWGEVVTAGGETLTASATEHPDLFWALRGGGGNFGVVTGLRFKLYPVARGYAGMSWHPADRAAPAGPFPAGRLRGGEPGRRRAPAAADGRAGPPRPAVLGRRDGPYERGHQRERVDAAMDRLIAGLRPGASGGSFLNFLSDPARTETAYTAGNYRRLAGLKRVWDPDNLFHLNHNIPPG